MSELILLRHGQSEHHVKRLTGGWTDTPLTLLGRQQAARTAYHLFPLIQGKSIGFFSSDLKRARETAEIMADVLELTPIFTAELRELNWGIAKDMSLEEANRLKLPRTQPLMDWIPFPEAESRRMLYNRIAGFMENSVQDSNDLTLIVSHGNAITAILQWWLLIAEDQLAQIDFDIDVGSITHLRINEWNQKTISRLNSVSHLESLTVEI